MFSLILTVALHLLFLHVTEHQNASTVHPGPQVADSSSTTTSTSTTTTTTTTTTTPTTTTSTTTTPTTTTPTTTTPTTTTRSKRDSVTCWMQSNASSPDVCHLCGVCRPELSSGGIAGIVIAVIVVYVLSLILTALLVSYYTKKGILDIDELIFIKIWKRKTTKDETHQKSNPNQNDRNIEQSGIYTSLQRPNPDDSSSDQQTYTTLRDLSRGSTIGIHTTNDHHLANGPEVQGEAESRIPGTPKSRDHQRKETIDATEKTKPRTAQKPPRDKKINEEEIYQNSSQTNNQM